MRILVSARGAHEAWMAAQAGVDFIDLKDPARGALGALAPALIADIVRHLRRTAPAARISATTGDHLAEQWQAIGAQALAVGAAGVDYVKVGVQAGSGADRLLSHLGELRRGGLPVVPVLLADQGVPMALVRRAVPLGFPAIMLDTQDKGAGSLLDRVSQVDLGDFVREVRAGGGLAGLAGALRTDELPKLASLDADFAGFRSAVCEGDRAGAMHAGRLALLLARARCLSPRGAASMPKFGGQSDQQ